MHPFTLFICRAIASGFGSGFVPLSPGTVGSVAACLVWGLLRIADAMTSVIALSSIAIVGFFASSIVMKNMPSDSDPQWIVVDEWCGMWIALACCPSGNFRWMGMAFVLFRFFDITKWGPIGWAERVPGALGVMLDDIVAGLSASSILLLARVLSS